MTAATLQEATCPPFNAYQEIIAINGVVSIRLKLSNSSLEKPVRSLRTQMSRIVWSHIFLVSLAQPPLARIKTQCPIQSNDDAGRSRIPYSSEIGLSGYFSSNESLCLFLGAPGGGSSSFSRDVILHIMFGAISEVIGVYKSSSYALGFRASRE